MRLSSHTSVTFKLMGWLLEYMPVIKISQEHKDKVSEIQDEHDLHVTMKSIVENAIDEYYEQE